MLLHTILHCVRNSGIQLLRASKGHENSFEILGWPGNLGKITQEVCEVRFKKSGFHLKV